MIQKPEFIKFTDSERIKQLKNTSVSFVDCLPVQIEELCEIQNPKLRDEKEQMDVQKKNYLEKYKNDGVYCYLPWSKTCVSILNEYYFTEVRTARNKDLITFEEQKSFRNAKVAIAGLSVGSNIARLCVLQGGTQKINIADADEIGLTNLNRILAGIGDLGKKKTQTLAEKLCEMDPYVDIKEFDGVNEKNVDEFVHFDDEFVDVIVEEIDSLPMKIALREKANEYKIPLFSITDNGDGVLVDIERYDQGFDIHDFYKRLKKAHSTIRQSHGGEQGRTTSSGQEKMPAPNTKMTTKQIVDLVSDFIGYDDIDKKMIASADKVGETLYSWPQLGGAAVLAGTVGAYVVRQIACKKEMPSGRYIISLDNVFKIS